MKDMILVVDDVEINREILIGILEEEYEILQACDGLEAIEMVKKYGDKLSMVLLDIVMPKLDGFGVMEFFKSNDLKKIPVIIITATGDNEVEAEGLRAGAVDFIGKPFHYEVVKFRVANHIELNKHRQNLQKMLDEKIQEVMTVRDVLVEAMASVIEYRHLESGEHIMRTKKMFEILLKHVIRSGKFNDELQGMNPDIMVKAVPLHDLGKIGIPDEILLKPGKLTAPEFDVIKQHPIIGAKIIDSIDRAIEPQYIKHCKDICLYHHERWDGSGYPFGLKGKEIPISARIMIIVDIYDALTSQRVYKGAFSHEDSLEILYGNSHTYFDKELFNIFLENVNQFKEVSATE